MNKAIFPEAVRPGRQGSIWAEVKLNAWAMVAVLASFLSHLLLPRYADWHGGLRAIIALAPLVPSLLYVRSLARWISGLDELQRRVQLEACLFATIGTIFLAATLNLLTTAGVLNSLRLRNGLGWEGTFAAIIFLYVLGNVIFNRRYR